MEKKKVYKTILALCPACKGGKHKREGRVCPTCKGKEIIEKKVLVE